MVSNDKLVQWDGLGLERPACGAWTYFQAWAIVNGCTRGTQAVDLLL